MLRVVTGLNVGAVLYPIAKIPAVLLPAAAPAYDVKVAAVAAPTAQLEYVYLLRVVLPVVLPQPNAIAPNANIANVPSSAAVMLLLNALIGDGP